jgi:fluoroacetyl-CoA thioesterase
MIDIPKYEVGSNIIIQKTVGKDDTGLNFGSGKLDTLFATPSLVALMIEAAVELVDGKLPEGLVSICRTAEVTHENTTILGETVSIKVEVEHINGNHIFLKMLAYDETGTIGTGSTERIIVNENALLNKANKRAELLQNKNF